MTTASKALNVAVERDDNATVLRRGGVAFRVTGTNAAGKAVSDHKLSGMVVAGATIHEYAVPVDGDYRRTELVQRPALWLDFAPHMTSVVGEKETELSIRSESEWEEVIAKFPKATRIGFSQSYAVAEPFTINGRAHLENVSYTRLEFFAADDGQCHSDYYPAGKAMGMVGQWRFRIGYHDAFSEAGEEIAQQVAVAIANQFGDIDFADSLNRTAQDRLSSATECSRLMKAAQDAREAAAIAAENLHNGVSWNWSDEDVRDAMAELDLATRKADAATDMAKRYCR